MSEQMSLEQVVNEALNILPDRERTVLELRYGYRGEPMTQKDLGAELGVSGTRIQQIEEKALRKIRYSCWIKELFPLIYYAVSPGQDSFYARFFIRVFKLNQGLIDNLLEAGPPVVEKESAEEPGQVEITPSTDIVYLRLSIRYFDCLMRAGIHTVQELLDLPYEKLCKIKNLNEKSLAEIQEKREALMTEVSE
jgi:hypothetical protein